MMLTHRFDDTASFERHFSPLLIAGLAVPVGDALARVESLRLMMDDDDFDDDFDDFDEDGLDDFDDLEEEEEEEDEDDDFDDLDDEFEDLGDEDDF